ncbi:MAG: low molecular weight phosphotyrosine protein phosphatase [Flavobacteriia bacterium]|nr:low molecular weight phosphotyrosine protein phosphatase [Flavobacteriia bacterium]
MNILMVCLGNICRSPLADGLLRKKVKDLNLDVYVDSAGTANYHVGEAPDHRMCQTAKKFGYSIDELRGRQFVVSDFDTFDLIYAMDKSNLSNILKLARNQEDVQKVALILNESHPEKNLEVPDPYYGGEKEFIEVYNLLNEATDVITASIKHIKK